MGFPIKTINILKTPLTGTQIAELASRLKIKIKELVDPEYFAYTKRLADKDFSSEDWITMIQNHPQIMKQPIALRGNRAIIVETPTDIIRI
ncbi:hypothetical protein RQM65_14485 [Pricia sp. S334]|uniref:Arsenate reductase n=1 Tax=Pricia mediterranea TaxID=3076079 RepID=A0ABU3L8J0_9FLAO|nr:hypothetical protein [Pricia sp. S334]MDT7829878.1 hypothetical protein [Pricia sp. S334]